MRESTPLVVAQGGAAQHTLLPQGVAVSRRDAPTLDGPHKTLYKTVTRCVVPLADRSVSPCIPPRGNRSKAVPPTGSPRNGTENREALSGRKDWRHVQHAGTAAHTASTLPPSWPQPLSSGERESDPDGSLNVTSGSPPKSPAPASSDGVVTPCRLTLGSLFLRHLPQGSGRFPLSTGIGITPSR